MVNRQQFFLTAVILGLVLPTALAAERQYPVKGLVLQVDPPNRTFVASHETIPGVMDAMTMPFEVRDDRELEGLEPGTAVEFTLVVGERSAHATGIRVIAYFPTEQHPLIARRLSLLKRLVGGSGQPAPLSPGDRVPDFTLIDERRQPVSLETISGKTVAVTFIYTRCALPQFCARVTNNFSVLQRRFREQLGRDLVLLTITFDPQRDTPDVMAGYAAQWDADPDGWRFLTGRVSEVRRVAALFGVEHFPDEGQMNHSLRTAVIDRDGRLVASLEGNRFTPEQLGDLVETVLQPRTRQR
jgi:protein SCO1